MVRNDSIFLNSDDLKLKKVKHGEPRKLYGALKLIQNISNNIIMEAILYKKQGGEFRLTGYKLKGSQCKLISSDKVFYPTAAAQTVPPLPLKVQ